MTFPLVGSIKRLGGCVPVYPAPDLTNCLLWLDATDKCSMWQDLSKTTPVTADGQDVVVWDDKSGGSNDFNTLFASPPVFITSGINSLPCIDTTSVTNRYENTSLTDSGVVLFAVYRTDIIPTSISIQYIIGLDSVGTFKDQGLFMGGTAASGRLGIRLRDAGGTVNAITSVAAAINTTYVHAVYKDSGNLIQRVNGVEVYNSSVSQPLNINNPYLFQRSDAIFYFLGQSGDFLIYQDTLSNADILNIESYLLTKYL